MTDKPMTLKEIKALEKKLRRFEAAPGTGFPKHPNVLVKMMISGYAKQHPREFARVVKFFEKEVKI